MKARDQKCNLRWSTGWNFTTRTTSFASHRGAAQQSAAHRPVKRVRNRVRQTLVLSRSLLGAEGNKSGPIDSVRSAGKTLTRTSRRSKRRWTVRVVLPNLLRRQALQLGKDMANFEAKEMPQYAEISGEELRSDERS